jgi:hypothetical protein
MPMHTRVKYHIEKLIQCYYQQSDKTCYNIEVNAKIGSPLLNKYFVTRFEITIKAIYLSARIQKKITNNPNNRQPLNEFSTNLK